MPVQGRGGVTVTELVPMCRLYNPNSGEHVCATSLYEYQQVINAGWHGEGVAWS